MSARNLKVESHVKDRAGAQRPLADDEWELTTADLSESGGTVVHQVVDDAGEVLYEDSEGSRGAAALWLRMREPGAPSEPSKGDLVLDATYTELVSGDRAQLDAVVRTVMLNEDCDYVAALDRLGAWTRPTGRGSEATLRQMLDAHPRVSVTQFQSDLAEMDTKAQEMADQIDQELTAWDGPEPDEHGRIPGDSATLAEMLADPVKREQAYLEARRLGGAEAGEEGRAAFEQNLRLMAEEGVNHLETIRHHAHQRAHAQRLNELETRRLQWEVQEREKRAGRTDALQRIRDAQDDLRRTI